MPISEAQSGGNGIRVFISYSHKDEKPWKDLVVTHLKPLVHQGDLVLWNDRKIGTGADWYSQIADELEKANIAICLISADYLASDFINKEEIPAMKRRRRDEGMLLLPLLLSPCPWNAIKWLKGIQMFPRDGVSLEEIRTKVQRKKALADFVLEISKRIAADDFATRALVSAFDPPDKVDITRLPETGAQLFGREKEIQLLDEMWDSGSANAVSLVAWGGVGKSTLVNQWLAYLKADNYRGAKRVYGWSFYSQGTGQRVTSADQFISEALVWFGDPDPREGSPWDKGERLAELIRLQKTLLILDGLEPLQSGLGFEEGKITDPALSSLVTQLARQNNGLCVVTTREKVEELTHHPKTTLQVDLEQISKEAGRALLRVGGVQGTDEELEDASEAFGNHALALSLLATYLHGVEGHHVSNTASIPDLDIPDAKGRHPRRVVEAFHARFGDSPQTQVLRVMGLFDRPSDLTLVDAVKAPPAITGLTDKLVDLTEGQWHDVFDDLRARKLLAPKSTHNPSVVDCHPLIREHFAERLKSEQPDAWKAGHRRLYEHLCATTKEGDEPTLEDLQPLYQAVAHGCQAGLQQKACDKVYRQRIQRGRECYSTFKLGAIGADLGAVACFFEQPWGHILPSLIKPAQAWLLNEAAFCLRALGRLTEAIEPSRLGLEMRVKQRAWANAARFAGNLSELELTLGEVTSATEDAERSVAYADRIIANRFVDRSDDAFQRMGKRTTHADALHQAGREAEAQTCFREAEQMQARRQPDYPLLYSVAGFRYCDLLLATSERAGWQVVLNSSPVAGRLSLAQTCRAVYQRAARTLQWAEAYTGTPLLDFALDHLTLGRAALYETILGESEIGKAKSEIERAVDGFHHAGTQDHLPRGLLTRAWLRFLESDPDGTQADLDTTWEIAERGSMRLHMADVHLHRARLFHDKESLAKAKKLIDECGYHRRDQELSDAEQASQNW